MRVTLLTGHLSTRRAAGIWTALTALAGALRQEAVDCRVVGLRDPKEEQGARDHPQVPIAACTILGLQAFGYAPGLARTVAHAEPDLVHTQGLWTYPSWAGLRWSERTGRPRLVSPHGMLDPWPLRQGVWKKRLVSRLFERANLDGATCLHATSAMEAGHFRRFGLKQPIAVIPNGIDLPPEAPELVPGPVRRLLFLSRLHPKKGLDLLLAAWGTLQDRHPDWELVVAGQDERGHRGEMEALVPRLGLRRVRFVGPAYSAAKTALFREADLFVLPSHAENFGIVVAEALGHGLPVVTTTGTPWQGLASERCGWRVELSPAALAAALDEATSLPVAERRAMGRRGRLWMERAFQWPAIAREMRAAYAWVLGGGSPPPCVITD